MHTHWMGVAKRCVLKLSPEMIIRIFGLLSQVLPVLKEWRSFNEFDYMDMLDVSTSYDQAQLLNLAVAMHPQMQVQGQIQRSGTQSR